MLFNPALVASAPLGKKLVVYSGVNGLVPIGDRERGIFTPPSDKVNVPIGATYAIGPWGLWGEGTSAPSARSASASRACFRPPLSGVGGRSSLPAPRGRRGIPSRPAA